MDEDSWADVEAVAFRPLTAVDADMAATLSTRFLERLVVDMSPTERVYALDWELPRFDVGITPLGGRVLGIGFGGGRSVTDWDGTVADAESIVDACAESSALNSEWDYWVQGGGWREWKGGTPPTP